MNANSTSYSVCESSSSLDYTSAAPCPEFETSKLDEKSVASSVARSAGSRRVVNKSHKIIDYEIVVVLGEPHASDPGVVFPKGAFVCFDQKTSPDIKHLEACEGFVTEVCLGRDPSNPMINGLVFIYTVEVMDGNQMKTQNFIQQHLAYASNCPVLLVMDGEERAGEVAFATRLTAKGQSKLTYTVVTRKGGVAKVEKGVLPNMLSYRYVEVDPSFYKVVEERDDKTNEKKSFSPLGSMKKMLTLKKVNEDRVEEV